MHLGLFHYLGVDVDFNLASLKNLVIAEHVWDVVGGDYGSHIVCQAYLIWIMYLLRPPQHYDDILQPAS